MHGTQKWCSTQMRDILIEHMDGAKVEMARRVTNGIQAIEHHHRLNTFQALLAHGLIKHDGRDTSNRPRFTVITEQGRETLSQILGDWADALRRSGFDVLPTNRGSVKDMRREQFELRIALNGGISGSVFQPSVD